MFVLFLLIFYINFKAYYEEIRLWLWSNLLEGLRAILQRDLCIDGFFKCIIVLELWQKNNFCFWRVDPIKLLQRNISFACLILQNFLELLLIRNRWTFYSMLYTFYVEDKQIVVFFWVVNALVYLEYLFYLETWAGLFRL